MVNNKIKRYTGLCFDVSCRISDRLLIILKYLLLYEPRHEKICPGFATRVDSDQPAQPQKLGRGLKFRVQKLEVLYYLGSENKGADKTARMRRLICVFVVRTWQKQVFS